MAALYIIVRTFPFWAIPTAAMLFFAFKRADKHAGSLGKKFKFLYLFTSILLLGISGVYLAFHGHLTAVPTLYEILQEPNAPEAEASDEASTRQPAAEVAGME